MNLLIGQTMGRDRAAMCCTGCCCAKPSRLVMDAISQPLDAESGVVGPAPHELIYSRCDAGRDSVRND